MKNVAVNEYSICSSPINLLCNGQKMGSATGFFLKHENRVYLVSNWHVFSGREPRSGQPKHIEGAIPDELNINYVNRKNLNDNRYISIPTALADGSPRWLQSKHFGQKADASVIDITKLFIDYNVDVALLDTIPCINDIEQVEGMFLGIGIDVFVLGFPLGIMKTGILPIWKRASIATEYDFDVNDMPSFLIDTATREGMSGAPVIQHVVGGYTTSSGGFNVGRVTSSKLLGLYSGRYIGELDEAHLGIVWKMDLINDIIENPSPGSFTLI